MSLEYRHSPCVDSEPLQIVKTPLTSPRSNCSIYVSTVLGCAVSSHTLEGSQIMAVTLQAALIGYFDTIHHCVCSFPERGVKGFVELAVICLTFRLCPSFVGRSPEAMAFISETYCDGLFHIHFQQVAMDTFTQGYGQRVSSSSWAMHKDHRSWVSEIFHPFAASAIRPVVR